MRLAIVYWRMIHSVGGIAIHLNRLRDAAIAAGDTCHILLSDSQYRARPQVYKKRKWISGGDTKIWICGEVPHHPANVERSVMWLENNYDAVCFTPICPHLTTAYTSPDFIPMYDVNLPKIAWVMDGYWSMYRHWAKHVAKKVQAILCPVNSYTIPIKKDGYSHVVVSKQPFQPLEGKEQAKSKTPLLVWPNQWKDIKGVSKFLEICPCIPEEVAIELYSSGIRYYQLRTTTAWQKAVGKDLFAGFDGEGRATYFGNVDIPEIMSALQRAWFTVNLQGMRSDLKTYREGSYNLTEVEALYYGACPILHRSTELTDLPRDTYISVASHKKIPDAIRDAIASGFALDPARQRRAREFVRDTHLASDRYQEMRKFLC